MNVLPLVSIVIPFHNEAEALPRELRRIAEYLDSERRVAFEVLLVDDGSHDASAAIARLQVDHDHRFRLIRLSRNFGKEAALTAGLRAAKGAAAIPMDADGQDPLSVVTEFITAWLAGAQVVLGRRADRTSDSILKRVTAQGFYRVFNRLTAMKLPESVGDFRLMDRQVLDAFLQLNEHERFLKGLFAFVGFEPVIVDYVRPARDGGHSKFSSWRLWNFALDGLFSFSTAPLRIWSYVGAITATLTACYAIFIFGVALLGDVEVPGYASTLIAVLVMGGLNLVGIGIVGEYIGRVYAETKSRPLYFIRETYPAEQTHG